MYGHVFAIGLMTQWNGAQEIVVHYGSLGQPGITQRNSIQNSQRSPGNHMNSVNFPWWGMAIRFFPSHPADWLKHVANNFL